MYLVLLFATTALLSTSRSANVNKHMKLLSELDNSIESNAVPLQKGSAHSFLTVQRRPLPSYTHHPGTVLELICDVVGSPAPSIHWFKNDAPVYEYEVESNELIDSNPSSLARAVSRLLVTRGDAASDRYACRAVAGEHSVAGTTVVYHIDDAGDLPERTKLLPLEPRIVVSYIMFLDLMGSNVVLPCRVKGHPRPRITWTDNKGNVVRRNPRMKVLRSGELVVSGLRWSDMGEFTCRASNAFGVQTAHTFVYPAKP